MAAPRPTTVVVGCDGSWHSHRAVVTATREAARRGGDLVVLVVTTSHDPGSHLLGDVLRADREALAAARAIAERGVSWANETDPTVRVRPVALAADDPGLAELLGEAVLLVLGGHGRGGQRAFSLGTTSRRLAHVVRAPLLLSAPDGPVHETEGTAVVVGLDAEPPSWHALDHAAYLATLRGAELVVVRAVLPTAAHTLSAVAAAAQECAAALASVEMTPPKVSVHVVVGPVVDTLPAACAPDSLLVLGNRGVGRVQGPVPGSLTQRLMERATSDVLVVPLPGEPTEHPAREVAAPQHA
jgi:nucleotide-binding universal stress UspA family protein